MRAPIKRVHAEAGAGPGLRRDDGERGRRREGARPSPLEKEKGKTKRAARIGRLPWVLRGLRIVPIRTG